jgi:hypothetical protein
MVDGTVSKKESVLPKGPNWLGKTKPARVPSNLRCG